MTTLDSYGKKVSTQYLGMIPHSEVEEFLDAGHPCYMDDPELFNTLLGEFLSEI